MSTIFVNGVFHAETDAGLPLVGGLLDTFDAGTTTPKTTWSDALLTAPNTNPVVLNVRGEAGVFWGAGAIRMRLRTAAGVTIWDVDNIPASSEAADLLRSQLASTASAAGGPALIGLNSTLSYAASTVGRRLTERVSPHDNPWLAPIDGVTDSTAAVQACLTFAASNGRGVDFRPGTTYVFSQLIIPADSEISAMNAVFRSDGSLTTPGDITLDIGDNVLIDQLNVSTPGTDTNTDVIRIGDNVTIGELYLSADTQRAGGGAICEGQNFRCQVMRYVNIDRPWHFNNASVVAQTTGSYIGHLECTSYVRGFRADFCSFTVGTMKMQTRSANASKSAGHNGVLIVGCADWQMGDLYIADAGEHAFRVGGSPGTYAQTRDFQVGSMYVKRSGGCALKINPTLLVSAGVTEKCERWSFGNIIGVDVGDGTLSGNEELLRLTHAFKGRIASALAFVENETFSGQLGLIINDCNDVSIGELGGEAINAGFISIDGTSDVDGVNQFGGDVVDLRIGMLSGIAAAANNAISVNTTFNVGRVAIEDMDITGFTTNLLLWSAGTSTGAFEIKGRVTGAVAPAFSGTPASANLLTDITYTTTQYRGRIDGLRFGVNAVAQFAMGAFDPGNVLPSTVFLSAVNAASGVGNYGGAIEMGRPGSGRRGGAVAVRQYGANVENTGVEILVSANTLASDQLQSAVRMTHERALLLVDGVTAPATTAGWASLYVDSADGDLKVKFGDGFVRVIAADS